MVVLPLPVRRRKPGRRPRTFLTSMENVVNRRHASVEVKCHAVYAVLFKGMKQNLVAKVFNKSKGTISKWVKSYKKNPRTFGSVLPRGMNKQKIYPHHLEWIIQFVSENPESFLEEIQIAFASRWGFRPGIPTLFEHLSGSGFVKKRIERQSKEIRWYDIQRFSAELNFQISECGFQTTQLLFLDEMAIDNRSMARTTGWFRKGQRPVWKGYFRRSKRISSLCFVGWNGVKASYLEENGTFTRQKFFECVLDFLDSGHAQPFPGPGSIWIMDGAAIHLGTSMISFLRCAGIYPIFLPAYCPFYNPIELFFSMVKKDCKKKYNPKTMRGHEGTILLGAIWKYERYDMTKLYRKCGYTNNSFDYRTNFPE